MEGESKQRKVLVLKKVENISRAWCSIEHAEWTVLWNTEYSRGAVPHCPDIVNNLSLSLFEPLLPRTSWTLLASPSLPSSVSYNLTSIHLCFSSSVFHSFPYWAFCLCLLFVYGHPHLSSGIDSWCWHPFPHTSAHTLPAFHGFHCAFVGVLLCQHWLSGASSAVLCWCLFGSVSS